MKENKNTKIYLAAVSYSTIIGLSFLFGKIALENSAPFDLLAYRFSIAFIAIHIPIIFKWIKIDVNKTMIKKILPLVIFYPLASFGFQAFGLQYTNSSEAGMLGAVVPVFTMILASFFLNEKTTKLQKLSILLSVSGVIYITLMKGSSFDFSNTKGILLLLISVVSFATFNVMARKLTKDFSAIELSYVMITISFIAFNILAISKHLVDGNLANFFDPLKHRSFIIAVLYLGVLSTFGTAFLSTYVLSKLEASKTSVFSNLSTVISIIAGVVILNEKIYYYHIIGSIFIISGVIGVNIFGKKVQEELN